MKPQVLITRPVSAAAIELLSSVCDTLPRIELQRRQSGDFRLVSECSDAMLLGTTEHIDVAACTRRGIWVTSVATRDPGSAAEIEAARNILDALGGDTPRGAMNEVMQFAA